MGRFFYVNGFEFDDNKEKIVSLTGYYTDQFHNNFLPTIKVSRETVINSIIEGQTFFIEDGTYKRIRVKLVITTNDSYLRIDCHTTQADYFG